MAMLKKKLDLHYTYHNSQSSVNKTLFATIHCSGAHINILLQFVCLSINFLTLFLNVWTCLQTEPAFYIYGSSIESNFWVVKLNIIISTSKAFQCFTFMFVMSKKRADLFLLWGCSGYIILWKQLVNPTQHSLMRHLERLVFYFCLTDGRWWVCDVFNMSEKIPRTLGLLSLERVLWRVIKDVPKHLVQYMLVRARSSNLPSLPEKYSLSTTARSRQNA